MSFRVKFIVLGLCGLVFICLPGAGRADFVRLNNDRIIQGKFKRIDKGMYLLEGDTQNFRVPVKDVKRLVIGYQGIPFCYQSQIDSSDNCEDFLFRLESDRVFLGTREGEPGHFIGHDFPLEFFLSLRFEVYKDKARLPVLSSGVDLELVGQKGENLKGKILSADAEHLVLKLKSGKTREIQAPEVKKILLYVPEIPEPEPDNLFWSLLPGARQISRGDNWSGALYLGGVGGFGLLWAGEYYSTRREVKSLNDNQLFRFFNSIYTDSRKARIARHVRNQRIFAGAALLSYTLHLLDPGAGSNSPRDVKLHLGLLEDSSNGAAFEQRAPVNALSFSRPRFEIGLRFSF